MPLPPPPRPRRVGPTLEIAAVIAAVITSTWWPIPTLIGLVAAGSVSRWARGRSWAEPGMPVPGLALIGAGLGLVALAASVALATPVIEAVTARAVEWSRITAARGNWNVVASVAMLLVAGAVASELVFRRWILDRIHGLGARPTVAAVIAATAEGACAGGHLGARVGAAAAGLGFGLLYVGAGRRLAPSIACRVVFAVGAIVLVGLRVV